MRPPVEITFFRDFFVFVSALIFPHFPEQVHEQVRGIGFYENLAPLDPGFKVALARAARTVASRRRILWRLFTVATNLTFVPRVLFVDTGRSATDADLTYRGAPIGDSFIEANLDRFSFVVSNLQHFLFFRNRTAYLKSSHISPFNVPDRTLPAG